jgi:hypothetical protein
VSSDPGWQFDVKLDHQINANHRIGGRYSRHHDVFTVPTVIGSAQGDGVIYTTDVQNGGLEYNWAITPTKLWTNRFSVDRVKAPGQTNNYPTLSDVGLPAILGSNGLTRVRLSALTPASSQSTPSVALILTLLTLWSVTLPCCNG